MVNPLKQIPADSVGVVTPQRLSFDKPLTLRSGRTIERYELMVESYGTLNAERSNAVLVCHALSGDHHAAGYYDPENPKEKPGWWDCAIGPCKPFDTNKFFVVSLNNLGGCAGSTGPSSINPETGKPFGPDFPIVTVRDWVNSQALLADRLGIQQWAAVIGGSLGGMQVMRWAISFPDRLRHAIIIAAAPKLSAQNIAFNEVARQSIMSDPEFHEGRYYDFNTYPKKGVTLARMVGHITYLSDALLRDKFGKDAIAGNFGRDLRSGKLSFGFDVDFQVQSYLQYKGETFSKNFDANTYLLVTKTLDYFDPAVDYDGDLSKAFIPGKCKFLVISFSSDWRFAPERSHEIVETLLKAKRDVSYLEIEADEGHDAFLLPVPRYMQALRAYMNRVAAECESTAPQGVQPDMRADLSLIQDWIIPGSRVLDLGCGDGSFLAHLKRTKNIRDCGLEIDADNIRLCLEAGVNVIEQNMDKGLANFETASFDTVVLAQTLQALHKPDEIVDEMLRVGKNCILTFPNFAYWRHRLSLLTNGCMPKSPQLPYEWYNTPNIHHCTIRDFDALCRTKHIRVLSRAVVDDRQLRSALANFNPNFFGINAIYHITR